MRIIPATRNTVVLALVATLAASSPLLAQQGRRQSARSGGNYDPATEVTLSGTVDEVVTTPGPAEGPGGIHVLLRSEAGIREVHVGPVAFMSRMGFQLAAGDEITVTGSNVTIEGEEAVIAREIRKGEAILTLRDAQGVPLWAGSRRR